MIKKIPNMQRLYEFIANEENARVCDDIPDEACRNIPKNFFTIIISNSLTKIGDALSSPKTVLTWLMYAVNAPIYLIGFLVPIRESGSMIPQLFIAGLIRKLPIRKWIWVLGSVLQFISILLIGFSALNFSGATAGYSIILFLILFSLSRGLCSVSSKDIIGKTVPKKRRGILNGSSATISGAVTILTGFFLITPYTDSSKTEYYIWIVFIASSLWLLASLIYSTLKEFPGEVSGGGNAIKEAIISLKLLASDKPFRNFVLSRALFLGSSLASPYYVIQAQSQFGNRSELLGTFILAGGIASSISAFIWGKFADKSSKRVMITGTAISSLLGITMFIIIRYFPEISGIWMLYPIAFFILSAAHSGVRIGRKTYILDLAGGKKRTDYVAVSNTIIGIILLLTGLIGTLASFISIAGVILVFALIGICGIITAKSLPEVEQ